MVACVGASVALSGCAGSSNSVGGAGGSGGAVGGTDGAGGITTATTGGKSGGMPGLPDGGQSPTGGATGGSSTGGASGNDAGTGTTDAAAPRDGAAADARVDAGDARTDTGAVGNGDAGAGAGTDAGTPTCTLTGPATARTPIVYVIGDSTASLYGADLFPRMGWGQPLGDLFTPACATIQDKALSGRSSKSFFDEGAWTPVRDALRPGDYVLIQFGHNDEKSDDLTLFTDPFTTYEMYLSIYIDDTQAKGATPILLTSINRNNWSGTALSDTHGNYPVAVRQLATARKVALVDMTALTKSYFERIGQTATTLLFMDLSVGQFPNYPAGNVDNTHLQEVGARLIGRMTLADLYRQRLPPGTLAKAIPQAP
jgi:lysophospholipase L1-like esterase